MGACRQQEGSLSRTIEGNGGTGKRPSGSTVSTDGLVRSCVIHGKKALSTPCPAAVLANHSGLGVPGGTRAWPCDVRVLAVGGPARPGVAGWEAVPPLFARESC